MADEGFKRKLTAILSSDVEGYSRLMGQDEDSTIRTLTSYRELMSTIIQKHRGRVVDSPGDNLLAEFLSVVDAVRCAVEIQEELRVRNAELSENRQMLFRIGINLGDVVQEGERIYGDGVNVAARIEGLTEGGGICISGTAFDQVESKIGLKFEYLGEKAVKNIKKPVRVYRVNMESSISDFGMNMELPLPDKPSIAVLPFVNMSVDPEQEYFSDGITEEIITGISKVPHLFVIARTSTFTYKGKSVKVQQVGRELGVRYVLEGSIRKAGERLRITAQLVDAATGQHLWAERYDGILKDVFALQDEITLKILNALQVKLTVGEEAQFWSKGTDNLNAYLKYLQAREHVYQLSQEKNVLARQMLEEVIRLDPNYAMAYMTLAHTHALDISYGISGSSKESLKRAFELAKKAIELDDSLAEAHGILGLIYLMKRQHNMAIAEGRRAVAINPNSAECHNRLGFLLRYAGEYEEALSSASKAIRLNPFAPGHYFHQLGMVYCMMERYEEAIAACKKGIRREPNNIFAHLSLAIIYFLSGREQDARMEAAEVLRIDPNFSLSRHSEAIVYKNQADTKRVIEALRMAGLK
jgi:adenylate cyclase